MRTLLKIFMIAGILLVVTAFIMGLKFNDIKNHYIDDHKYDEQIYTLSNDVENINLNFIDRNIEVFKSDTNETYIEYYTNEERDILTINEENDNLNFNLKPKRRLFGFINTKFTTRKVKNIKLYLTGNINNLSLIGTVATINLNNMELESLNINLTTDEVNKITKLSTGNRVYSDPSNNVYGSYIK